VAGLPRSAVHRIACAVIREETPRLLEHGMSRMLPDEWPDTLAIGDDGLGLDSLEQLGALGALAETFQMDDSLLDRKPPTRVSGWIEWIMRQQAGRNGQIMVRTSGSSGDSVSCVHAVADLLGEAAFLAERFADRRRIVALVPAHHLYGMIWTALLPSALDVPLVVRAIGAPLGLAAGDLVVGVPDQWQAMLRLIRRFPDDVIGVSSAAPLDEQVGQSLLDAGLARLVDIYGSSETGGIALREVPSTNYDLLPRWRLSPCGDDDWQLADSDGRLRSLPDHIERVGDRALRPISRRDGMVQVAGHNVSPARVAAVLREVNGVADAAVRLHSNGRLKAFVVPDGDRDPAGLSALIDQALAARLSDPERPKNLRYGNALPRNAMGKLKDWA
jgi:4-coumarate--CoA ligase (photoactive yellow protein activation family)